MTWTPDLDARLSALGDVSPAEAASLLSAEFNATISPDAVSSRRRRRKLAADLPKPEPLAVPASPDYIGPTIAFWDLETTFGSGNRILCGSIADAFGKVETWDTRDLAWLADDCTICPAGSCDAVVSEAIRNALEGYTIIAGWNSRLYDQPVLNARLARHGLRPVNPQMHVDLMYYASGQFMRIGRRSLQHVSEVFRSPHSKTPLDEVIWDRADHGDTEAYDLIVEHNVADVLVTRDVYAHLQPFIRNMHRGG